MKTLAQLLQWGLLASLLSLLLGCGSGSGPVSNNQAEPVITVSLTEHNLTIAGGETHQFAASVAGSSNPNITWSLSGCTGVTCGSISPSGLYTAPSVVSAHIKITVTAAAQADPVKTDYATVELMPIAVSISPAGAWVTPGGTQAFTASVLYDSHKAGVNWALGPACSDTCGTLKNVAATSVTYTAPVTTPDSSVIRLTASSVSDFSKKAEIIIALGASVGMAEGDYSFVFNGWETPITNGYYWMYESIAAGRFHADDQGNITQGLEDINSMSGVNQALPFTGNYSLGADGRGTFTFMTAQGSATYHMVLDASKSSGKFVRYDALQPDWPIFGSGYFELQDKAAFSLAALAGPYAFGASGGGLRAVGRFDADASGVFTGGAADQTQQVHGGNDPQVSTANFKLTGSFGAPSAATGRGTAILNWGSPYNFAYYIVSNQKIVMVQIDERNQTTPVLSGEFRRQKGPFSAASFSAPAIFKMAGADLTICGFYVNAAVGQVIPDGSGSITGVYDDNWGTLEEPFTGSYTVAANGRSELQMKRVGGTVSTHTAYFFGPNEAFLMQTSGTDALFGRLRLQVSGPFNESSLSGTYLTHTGPPAGERAENDSGLTTFDGSGGLTSSVDVNLFGELQHLDFDGTYTVAPNGRGKLIFSSPANGSAVFWVVSPNEIVSTGAIAGGATLLEYEKQEVTAVADVR